MHRTRRPPRLPAGPPRRVRIGLLIALVVSGCAVPRVTFEPPDRPYTGLAQELAEPPDRSTLHVIFTHGMGHDYQDNDSSGYRAFGKNLIRELEKTLGVELVRVAGTTSTVATEPGALGALQVDRRIGQTDEALDAYKQRHRDNYAYISERFRVQGGGPCRELCLHWIAYSWYLGWIKSPMAGYDRDFLNRSDYLVNRTLKAGVMNDGFPDAVAYLNPAHREVIHEHFFRCFRRVERELGSDDRVALVSSSLGSIVMLDAFNARRSNLARQTSHFFMFANQVPLLKLGIQEDRLRDFVEQRMKTGRGPADDRAALTVVAFSDPSDLLTYPLNPALYERPGVTVANVGVRNAGIAVWPILRDPASAHSQYVHNRHVMTRIANGSGRRPD